MTPEWAVRSLLTVERIFGPVWEPACGEGAIVNVLSRQGYCKLLATDVDGKFMGPLSAIDFLGPVAHGLPRRFFGTTESLTIITNPPYGQGGALARAFVERAILLTVEGRGRVIMLLPNEWDSAPKRQHLFEDFPAFVGKYTLTKRIRWTNLPQSKNGPSQNHAWFVWDHARKGRDIGWIGGGE